MSTTPYEPFDQDTRVGPPPWSPADPALRAWEAAHGHDIRLKCYVEHGCQVIESALEARIDSLQADLDTARARIAAAHAACRLALDVADGDTPVDRMLQLIIWSIQAALLGASATTNAQMRE